LLQKGITSVTGEWYGFQRFVSCSSYIPKIPKGNFFQVSAPERSRARWCGMFEQEIELEKKAVRSSSTAVVAGLNVVLVGMAVYCLAESRRVVTIALVKGSQGWQPATE
jgi:hypothetical protein